MNLTLFILLNSASDFSLQSGLINERITFSHWHGVVDQEIAEQGEQNGDKECRTGQHATRQAMHFRKGVIRGTKGVEHRKLVSSLAVEHDLGEVPDQGRNNQKAGCQCQDHGTVILQALDAGLKVVPCGDNLPIREGGYGLTDLSLGLADGIHVGALVHVDLQIGTDGRTAREIGIVDVSHTEGDGILGVESVDHGADRIGLIAEFVGVDLLTEQLLGIQDNPREYDFLTISHYDLIPGLELIGFFVVDILADDDTVFGGQNCIGVAFKGGKAVVDDIVDPKLVHGGIGIVVHSPAVAVGSSLFAGYGVFRSIVQITGLEEQVGKRITARQADVPFGVADAGNHLQLLQEKIHVISNHVCLFIRRLPGLVSDDLTFLSFGLLVVIQGAICDLILVRIQIIMEALHLGYVESRNEKGGEQDGGDHQAEVVLPHTPEAVELVFTREILPEQEKGSAGGGDQVGVVPGQQMAHGRLLRHAAHGKPHRYEHSDDATQKRNQHGYGRKPQTDAARDVERPRDPTTDESRGDPGQKGNRKQLATRRAHELGEIRTTGHVHTVDKLEVVQTNEEQHHHHEDGKGQPSQRYRPKLDGIGRAVILVKGIERGETDITMPLGYAVQHVVVDFHVCGFHAEGSVQKDPAGIGTIQERLTVVDPIVSGDVFVFPGDLVGELGIQVYVLLVIQKGYLNVVIVLLGNLAFCLVHIGLGTEGDRPEAGRHDQGGKIEADILLPVFGDALEGVFQVGRVEYRADGGKQGREPLDQPLGAGFFGHGETVLSCRMHI